MGISLIFNRLTMETATLGASSSLANYAFVVKELRLTLQQKMDDIHPGKYRLLVNVCGQGGQRISFTLLAFSSCLVYQVCSVSTPAERAFLESSLRRLLLLVEREEDECGAP